MPASAFVRSITLAAFAGSLTAGSATADDRTVHAVIFESLDASPSVFSTTGIKAAPDGVERQGFTVLGSVGTGLRFERGPAISNDRAPILVRATFAGSILPGYQFFADWGVVSIFAGPEVNCESLGGRFLPTRYGLRLHGEVWARPSENTLATTTLIVGSARWDLYARASWGYRLFGAYLGPEIAHYRDNSGYRRLSLGIHATDFAISLLNLRVSAGYQYEGETERFAPYLGMAGWLTL